MRVRLTRKLADIMEGVALSHVQEGDVLDLSERDAGLLIRGGWAERVPSKEERVSYAPDLPSAIAAERSKKR